MCVAIHRYFTIETSHFAEPVGGSEVSSSRRYASCFLIYSSLVFINSTRAPAEDTLQKLGSVRGKRSTSTEKYAMMMDNLMAEWVSGLGMVTLVSSKWYRYAWHLSTTSNASLQTSPSHFYSSLHGTISVKKRKMDKTEIRLLPNDFTILDCGEEKSWIIQIQVRYKTRAIYDRPNVFA